MAIGFIIPLTGLQRLILAPGRMCAKSHNTIRQQRPLAVKFAVR
ncbi:hypothetical protein BN130_52 [Cronobacter malonaticus 507]|nr:hypothetical protein BN130_52 [Cronobacter malonaticus 507]